MYHVKLYNYLQYNECILQNSNDFVQQVAMLMISCVSDHMTKYFLNFCVK
jgi:hypothetical protein